MDQFVSLNKLNRFQLSSTAITVTRLQSALRLKSLQSLPPSSEPSYVINERLAVRVAKIKTTKSIYQDADVPFHLISILAPLSKLTLSESPWYTMEFIYFRLIDVSRWSFRCSPDANKIWPLRFD